MNNRTTKKKPIFLICYISFFSLLIIAVIIGLRYLWCVLEDYENTLPDCVIDKVVTDLNNKKYDNLIKEAKLEFSDYNNEGAFTDYLDNQIASEKVSRLQAGGSSTGDKTYVLYAKKNKIATVKLKEKPQKSRYGFKQYELGEVTATEKAINKLVINAPSSAKVLLNGKELVQKFITGKDIEYKDMKSFPSAISKPTMVQYTIDETLFTANVTAKGFLGNDLKVTKDEKTGEINVSSNGPAELEEKYKQQAIDVAKAQCNYITADIPFSELSKYLLPNTNYAKRIASLTNKFYADHVLVEFNDLETSDFMMYNDKMFSLTVSFDHTVYRKKGLAPNVFPTKLNVYFVNSNNKWQAVNVVTIS